MRKFEVNDIIKVNGAVFKVLTVYRNYDNSISYVCYTIRGNNRCPNCSTVLLDHRWIEIILKDKGKSNHPLTNIFL